MRPRVEGMGLSPSVCVSLLTKDKDPSQRETFDTGSIFQSVYLFRLVLGLTPRLQNRR